jgi:hypothetical protein
MHEEYYEVGNGCNVIGSVFFGPNGAENRAPIQRAMNCMMGVVGCEMDVSCDAEKTGEMNNSADQSCTYNSTNSVGVPVTMGLIFVLLSSILVLKENQRSLNETR